MGNVPSATAQTPSMLCSEDCWHAMPIEAVADRLGVDPAFGLSEEVAHNRFLVFGPNRVSPRKEETAWQIFLEEIREPMIVLLLVTGALYAIWGELRDTLTIFLVILALVSAEVLNERRAKRAISALTRLAEPTSRVLRGGQIQEIPSDKSFPAT